MIHSLRQGSCSEAKRLDNLTRILYFSSISFWRSILQRHDSWMMNVRSRSARRQMIFEEIRGVAQPGSALGSGPRSREFKSPLPDHLVRIIPSTSMTHLATVLLGFVRNLIVLSFFFGKCRCNIRPISPLLSCRAFREQPVQLLNAFFQGGIREVRVPHRHRNVAVPEMPLNDLERHSFVGQDRRTAMS